MEENLYALARLVSITPSMRTKEVYEMTLMEEEQLVLRWLSEYGPMTKEMIQRLLHYKPKETVSRILSGLKRRRYITEIENHRYLAINPYCKVDPRMHEALWVLFQFAEHVEPHAHRTDGFRFP